MNIKLLSFDLDDTLWDAGPLLRNAEQQQFQWLYQNVPDFEANIQTGDLKHIRKILVAESPALMHDLSQLRTQILQYALRDIGYSRPDSQHLAEQAFEIFLNARHDVNYFEHAIDLLADLSKDYTLAALSNGNADIYRLGLDKYFSIYYSAASIGAPKPAPDMFVAAMRTAGVTEKETIHVGDHPIHDIQGASSLGIASIWVNLGTHSAPASGLNFKEVNRLSDIPACLKSF